MSEMDPDLRALVEAARPLDEPTERDRSQNRRALARRLGSGAIGTGVLLSRAARVGAAQGGWFFVSLKVLAPLALCVGIGGGVARSLSSPGG
jgi:hypothetical protein